MYRNFFFYTILIFSVFSVSPLFGQAVITIGSQTYTQRHPFGVAWGYERSASLYLSSEIGTPKTILELGWYVSNTSAATIPTKIYLKKTSSETLTGNTWANMISGATLVYEGNLQFNSTGWKTIEIDDFIYDENNLLILCETNYGGGGGSTPYFRYTYKAPGANDHQYWAQDYSAPTGNGTVTSYRPNLQLTYQLGDMTIESSTTEQPNTTRVLVGDSNQEIIRLKIVTDGSTNPISLNSISFNTNGTTSASDITNAKVYYTTSETFSTATQFGSSVNNPNGSFTVNGNQQLSYQNNYFWLAYDISNSAQLNNIVDAECSQFVTSEPGELTRIPAIQAPVGSRTIKSPLIGTYTISNSGGDFSNLSEAITSLNELGIGGSVVFNITAGQTFNEPGLINITATGTSARAITFQKFGEGDKPILNFTGTSGNTDAAIQLSGGDYFIFDGLDVRDAGTSSNDYVEYGFYFVGGNSGCQNNTIKNSAITMHREATASKGIYLVSGAANTTTANSNNKFYNNRIQNSAYGYYFVGVFNYEDKNNEIGTIEGGESIISNIDRSGIQLEQQIDFSLFNNEITLSSTYNSYNGIYISLGFRNKGNIYQNNIHSLNYSGVNENSGYGIFVAYGDIINIYKNQIHSSTVSDGSLYGIYAMYPTYIYVYKNKIYNLKNESSNWKSVVGIQLDSDITAGYVYNNFIYGLSAPAAPGFSVKGMIMTGSSSNFYIFHNTVFLSFESTNSANFISALFTNSSPAKIDLRNNIFVSKISGVYNKNLAHYRTTTSYSNISVDSDNNIYYAGTPSANNNIFYNGSTYYQTLTDYKTAIATKDQNSITEDVPFVSTTDPHIQTGIATYVKGWGKKFSTPIQITDDIDDEARNTNFPDIGADAGNFTAIDQTGPIIEYTVLSNTSSLDNRTLSATIEDLSGVNTTSAKPRIYFKKTTNANAFNDNTNSTDGWKYTETSSASSPYEFTINYSLINGGVTATEIIQYFVVSQDIVSTPNVSLNSGTPNASLSGVSLVSENFPIEGTINQYLIIGTLSGTYTVGVGGYYTTLTAAINDLNSKYLAGPVIFSLIDNTYPNETFPIVINANLYSSAENTITIKPATEKTPVISGVATTSSILKLNGVDYITIDGSNQPNGTDRSLTISNTYTSSSYTSAGIWLVGASAGNGCNNVTIKNCIVSTGANSNTYYYGISVSSSNIGAAGFDHDNLTIQNNEIIKSGYGIYCVGSSSGTYNNLNIIDNIIGGDASTSYVTRYGVVLSYCEDVMFRGNTVKNIVAGFSGLKAVDLSTGVKNCIFEKNIIRGTRISSGSYGPVALSVSPGNNPSNITIRNNIIYGVSGNGNTNLASNASTGIRILSGSGIYIYYNSVNLYGNISRSSATADNSAAVYISNSASDITLKNNIFKNSLINTTGVATAWAIYSDATLAKFTSIDYNNYYGGESQGKLGFMGNTKTEIGAWRTATGQDLHSLNANPYFSSNTTLKVPNYSSILNSGIPISGITTDYEEISRSETTPAIGAYETGYDPPVISWCNLQSPGSYTKGNGTLGFIVLAQVFIDGITSTTGASADLEAYIGYSTENTNPSSWTNWTQASFNVDVGNNDELRITLGENFPVGNYYYASKFVYKGNSPVYGGYSSGGGGVWNGTSYSSGLLTVNAAEITWCNLQSPPTVTQNEGSSFTVYGRVYIDGVTTLSGQQPGVKAWIGWNYQNTNPSTWEESKWREATFNTEVGNNDEYKTDIGANIQSGTAYYATRFQLLSEPYKYGGYSGGGGHFWSGIDYISGVVTVNEKIVTEFPCFEGMEQGFVPPPGWRDAGNDWEISSYTFQGEWGLGIDYDKNGIIITNSFVLGSNLQISFWWIDDDPALLKPNRTSLNKTAGIEGSPNDVTYFEITTDNGDSWTTLEAFSPETTMWDFEKATYNLSSYANKTVKFRWRNVTDGSEYALGFILDNVKIQKIPTATATRNLSNFWGIYTFTNTGVEISYSDNSEAFDLTVHKTEGNAGGALPNGLANLAPYYWVFEVEGDLDFDYSCYLKLDLSGLTGVNDFNSLHLLRRSNPGEAWQDLGTPYQVSSGLCTWDDIPGFSEFVIASNNDNPLPVELSSFIAKSENRDVVLSWKTDTEINCSEFVIERMGADEWRSIGQTDASGNSNSPKEYGFTDKNLNSGSYSYRLKIVDNDGSFKYSQTVEGTIDLPDYFELSQNYPNPFNPTTIINYQLPFESHVNLELYSVTGERVATLINETQSGGYYNFQLSTNSYKLSSGIYFYILTTNNKEGNRSYISTKKMIVIK